MDGNKRWARINKVSLKEGYQKGLNKLREIISICLEQEIKHLTVYALSTDNMKRVSVSTIFNIILNHSKKIINFVTFFWDEFKFRVIIHYHSMHLFYYICHRNR